MAKSAGGTASPPRFSHTISKELEADAVYLNVDENFLYAACTDNRVRVWSKKDWALIAELGETSSPPLAVHIDEEQVYSTCEKRVYVWNKNTWGMIGWFELTYVAETSTLRGDSLYVGSKEGRLVSIKKDTHETSSWQLFKSEITGLWGDGEIICTSTSKDEPVVWKLESEGAPTELKRLEKKDKGAKIVGTSNYIITASSANSIKLWDRVEWGLAKELTQNANGNVSSIWANDYYVVVAWNSSSLSIWDIRNGTLMGTLKLNGSKIHHVRVDGSSIYLATPGKIIVLTAMLGQQPFDLSSDENGLYSTTILRSSPYDVLESVLLLQQKGDELVKEAKFHEAVTEYEQALQLLIDNTHTLLEVPSERERLTNELNERLGHSLLRAKIIEIQNLSKTVQKVSSEFDSNGKSSLADEELVKLWNEATRAIKESRVLTDAQAGHILSYQLSHATDMLEEELHAAKKKHDDYLEKISEARTLVQKISSEWRLLERKRSPLEERQQYLDKSIATLKKAIAAAQNEPEVSSILTSALSEFNTLSEQISRIIAASHVEPQDVHLNKEETLEAIHGLLSVLERRSRAPKKGQSEADREREALQLINAIEQAIESAEQHKLQDEIERLTEELARLTGTKPDTVKATPPEVSDPDKAKEDAKPAKSPSKKKKRSKTKKS